MAMKQLSTLSSEPIRSVIPERYQTIEAWPAFDEHRIKDPKRLARFKRLKAAMEMYLSNKATMHEISSVAGVSARRFRRIVRRCFEPRIDGITIMGFEALVARRRARLPVRIKRFDYQQDSRSGYVGSFAKLLRERPQIEKALTDLLLGIGKKAANPTREHMRSIVAGFVRICEKAGVGYNEYPLNTVEKGRRALKAWMDQTFLPRHGLAWIKRQHGDEAASLAAYGSGDGQATELTGPYEVWVIDEVTVDLNARYEIPNNKGDWEQLDLPRFTALRCVEWHTAANLGWDLVLAKQVSGEDIARLLWKCVDGSPRRQLRMEGLAYNDGAGFPAREIPELRFAIFRTVYLDNALAHLADVVQHILQHLGGGIVVLGKPRTPKERALVESKFALQARRVLHQLPGTTGTGPKDPLRKSADVALEHRIRADDLEEVLEVYIANENIAPASRAGGIAPLERLRQLIAAAALKPTYLPVDKRKPHFFSQPISVTVRVDIRRGLRPFITYLGVRYTSPQLQRGLSLKGQTMYIRPDFSDLRSVLLFYESGHEYGPLYAMGRWSKFPHDVRLRKMWLRAMRTAQLGERADDAPLQALFSYLRAKAPRDRNSALKLAYLVDYLSRHAEQLDSELLGDVGDWAAGEETARAMGTLPINLDQHDAPASASAESLEDLPLPESRSTLQDSVSVSLCQISPGMARRSIRR